MLQSPLVAVSCIHCQHLVLLPLSAISHDLWDASFCTKMAETVSFPSPLDHIVLHYILSLSKNHKGALDEFFLMFYINLCGSLASTANEYCLCWDNT
jgi:hypothetical protein